MDPQAAKESPVAIAEESGATACRAGPVLLQDRIRQVATSLRNAFEAVVDAIEGRPNRPVALARALGVDKNLAGRVLAAIKEGDPFAVAHRLPAPQGLRLFLTASAKRKVPPETLSKAEEAVGEFEKLITREAGDRDALDAMISGWMPEMRALGERSRKQAVFKAMSYLLGYQADAKLAATIVQPSEGSEDTCDELTLFGCRGLHRLRPGAPVMVAAMGTRTPEATPTDGNSCFETLTGDHIAGHYLLKQFSTSPLTQLAVREEGDTIRFMLGDGGLGPDEGATLVFADTAQGTFARYRAPDLLEESFAAIQWMPCRVLVRDVFLRDDVWPGSHPKLTSNMLRPGDPMPQGRTSDIVDRLDVSETIQYLGKGTTGIHTTDVPGYGAMVNYLFDKLGWPRERFQGYRLHVRYPIPYMCYTMWFDLPRKPSD